MLGKIERIAERLRGVAALFDGREVEDGKGDHVGAAEVGNLRVWNSDM